MYSNTGTHIDDPSHLLKDHNSLDMLRIEHFYGSAVLLHCNDSTVRSIDVKELQPYQEKIQAVDFLLPHTGWSQYWGSDKYFTNYPVHTALLRNNIIINENLANLADIPCNQFYFSCFPLRFVDADGSPVRAVALSNNHNS